MLHNKSSAAFWVLEFLAASQGNNSLARADVRRALSVQSVFTEKCKFSWRVLLRCSMASLEPIVTL